MIDSMRHPSSPPSGPTHDPMLERILREEMRKQYEFLMEKFELVVKRVDSAAETCVRNESHLNRIEEGLNTLERTSVEIARKTKDSLSAEMKRQFEAQLEEFNKLHGKSLVQKIDSVLKDIETAEGFPARIGKLAERILYRLYVLQMLFTYGQFKPPQLKDAASQIALIPEKCMQLNWQSGSFKDLQSSATALLHSYFHTGYELTFARDVTEELRPLLSCQSGPFTFDSADLGCFWILKSRTDNAGSSVSGTIKFPGLYFGSLKGSISVPVQLNYFKGSLHFLHEYGGVFASLQAGKNPLATGSCVFGLKSYSAGATVGYNPVSKSLTKYDAGVSYNRDGLNVSLIRLCNKVDKTDTVTASAVYKFGGFAAGLQNSYTLSSRLNQLFLGVSCSIDPVTLLKARLGLRGLVSADHRKLIQPSVVGGLSLVRSWGRCALGISTEVDLVKRDAPRFGAFLQIGPGKTEPIPVRRDEAILVNLEDFSMVQ